MIPISFIAPLVAIIFTLDQSLLYAAQFLTMLLATAYYVIMHTRNGQTLGKLAFKVKVVNLEEKNITLQLAIIRSSPQIIQLLFLALAQASIKSPENQINQIFLLYGGGFYGVLLTVWSIANIMVALSNKKHIALHDYIAGTVVVKI